MTVAEPLDPTLVKSLLTPSSYPHDASAPRGIAHIQTHISHVFLSQDRVYKLRKAVSPGFLDFSTLAERRADCVREVDLNRRLALDVYLGVASVRAVSGGFEMGPVLSDPEQVESELGELAVVMRRLPDGGDALSLLEHHGLTESHVDRVAARIAEFHAAHRLGQPAPWSMEDWRARIRRAVWDNLGLLREGFADDQIASLHSLEEQVRDFEGLNGHRFEHRRQAGRAVDGHGDLHLDHIWFDSDGEPRVIDCLEFREDLRKIDAAADVAFLSMDLRYRGRGDLAERLLAHYAEAADDFDLYSVLQYFESYRAAVRAKVACLASRDLEISASQRTAAAQSASRHLDLARRVLSPQPQGRLLLTCGWVGTGKSSLARRLAEELPAIRIASDLLRKRLSDSDAQTSLSSGWDVGAYSAEARSEVYAQLRERAAPVLRSGRNVILDATFASRLERERIQAWADHEGLHPWLLHTVAPDEITRERLALREKAAADPSDAGPDFLEPSRRAFEAPEEWPSDRLVRIETHTTDWQAEIQSLVKRIRASLFG